MELGTLIKSTYHAYAKAERAIKRYERFAFEICNPAVNQLRCAGRRLAEALLVLPGDPLTAQAQLQKAIGHSERAYFDATDGLIFRQLFWLSDIQKSISTRKSIDTYYDQPGYSYAADKRVMAEAQEFLQRVGVLQGQAEHVTRAQRAQALCYCRKLSRIIAHFRQILDQLEASDASEASTLDEERIADQNSIALAISLAGMFVGFFGLSTIEDPWPCCIAVGMILVLLYPWSLRYYYSLFMQVDLRMKMLGSLSVLGFFYVVCARIWSFLQSIMAS